MKRATKHKPGGTGHGERENPNPLPAESNHNLWEQLQEQHAVLLELRAMLHTANERLAKLEQAVVPPSTWERVKGSVGL